MELLAANDLSGWLVWLVNALTAAIGLGMVIFVHELGHFAVAKWCGVFVERFSIALARPAQQEVGRYRIRPVSHSVWRLRQDAGAGRHGSWSDDR